MKILIMGGTTEASELARALSPMPGLSLVTSFAGRTAAPKAPWGETRVGGFGGVAGFTAYLRSSPFDAVVDATHPFAAVMPSSVATGCETTGTPRLRLLRPPWQAVSGDSWHSVASIDAVPNALDSLGARRVFLTTGRSELAPFTAMTSTWFLLRSIEAPSQLPLANADLILDRGPFTVSGETELLRAHRIDALVTKNSGALATAAKLDAARALGIPVVMVERPPTPEGIQVETVADALAWCASLCSS